jgi:transposase InsO family protein
MPEFADLPPSQIVPMLADRGIYVASESTMYKILKNESMLKHRGSSRTPVKSKHPTTHIANAPNQVWSWDITYLNSYTRGMYYKLYVIMDIFSRKIVGWEVWHEELGELAADLVERAVLAEQISGRPLVLHSDNGAPMKSYTLKAKLEMLGVMSSYSRPRVSNDNPYSEALFKTCKYTSSYPKDGFKNIEEARDWVYKFVNWYNNIHYHSGLNFVTPMSRHTGNAEGIMERRKDVYRFARALHPQRFNRGIRNWKLPDIVALNPISENKASVKDAI